MMPKRQRTLFKFKVVRQKVGDDSNDDDDSAEDLRDSDELSSESSDDQDMHD